MSQHSCLKENRKQIALVIYYIDKTTLTLSRWVFFSFRISLHHSHVEFLLSSIHLELGIVNNRTIVNYIVLMRQH